VNSQVVDHTSIIRFIESWLGAKRTSVRETNISDWRRTVCGDLTSAFRPYDGGSVTLPTPLDRDGTVERIYAAKFRGPPVAGMPLGQPDIDSARVALLQEPGTRPSCPLPYELVVNASARAGFLSLTMEARNGAFGESAVGAPFNAYSYAETMACRSYAVRAGDVLHDDFAVGDRYRVRVDGPNGFTREFTGAPTDALSVVVDHTAQRAAGARLDVRLANHSSRSREVVVHDESYGAPLRRVALHAGGSAVVPVDVAATHGWYDFTVRAGELVYRYAGRVETGKWSVTDPAMGRA
jgi:phospholipase C